MACVHVVVDRGVALPEAAAHDLGLRVVAPPGGAGGQAEFEAAYRELLDWGVEVLSVHGPAALGGRASAARAAADALAGAPISVVETPWHSATLGLLALRAALRGQDETPRGDLETELLDRRMVAGMVLAGADPGAAERAGEMATDAGRPILHLAEGRLRLRSWSADVAQALRAVADAVLAALQSSSTAVHLGAFSTGADAEAAALAAFLEGRLYPAEVWIAPADGVTAAIGGPGSFGVAFYAEAGAS